MDNPEKKRVYTRNSTHKILDISYARTDDYPDGKLECLCGWIGRAWDALPGDPTFGDEKDWPKHRREAPPINIHFVSIYRGKYGTQTVIRPSKKEVAA